MPRLTNPYHQFVSACARLVGEAKTYPLGGFKPPPRPDLTDDAPKAIFFAPHPDDECIGGGLALRLMREAGMRVVNVAVTQGRHKERQLERYRELQGACSYLGFGLVATGPRGLDNVDTKAREQDREHWSGSVKVIAQILASHQPRVIFLPHERDWHPAHIGTHFLVIDALEQMPAGFECFLVETEFWGQMSEPNLLVEISERDLGDLVTATTFHVGEVKRNPYHVLMPAWMMDNVRRGAELVGGQGGAAPDFAFAAIYRLRKWSDGGVVRVLEKGKLVSRQENVGGLFADGRHTS